MPQASNEAELQALLMPHMKSACDYVAKKLYDENQDVIEEIVYNVYTPHVYNRQRDLIRAWDSQTDVDENEATMLFEYQADQTVARSYVTGEIVRNLAEIVYEGLAGPIFGQGPWTKKRDAWSALLKRVGPQKIKRWFTEGLKQSGLKGFQSHISSIT